MNLHEYQSKELLRRYGIDTPRGIVVESTGHIGHAWNTVGNGRQCVVKAQIHAGGRGKAGGVKLVGGEGEARGVAEALLGSRLVTFQNAPDGQTVGRLLVEETLAVADELYLSITVDRETARIAIVASASGGMDIEEVARERPEAVGRAWVEPAWGLRGYQIRNLASVLGVDAKAFAPLLKGLYALFCEQDLSLLEINPLARLEDGRLVALDCKVAVDDNALFRHADLAALRDDSQVDGKEALAREADLNYIALDGEIGCMVNGAGLAMATMDIIKLHGGRPANFLDVGGGATAENVARAFKILLSDAKVKAVLVNIFGGIMRCDVIAEGIIAAVRDVGVQVPVVVRLEGTNVELGRKMLAESGLAIIAADGLTDAARKAVAATG